MENTDKSDASGLLVPEVNEDSVDIYDGLDIGLSSNAEEPPSVGSQLKESMDLYEEIVTEEQQSRDSSYCELKSRFQAAQNHIQELHKRLEQLESQNASLSTENHCLKKNISALLRTARQEVIRKDAEIQRLNQWAERGRRHHPSQMKNLCDPNSSSRCSTSTPAPPPISGPPPPPPRPPPSPSSPSPPPPPPPHHPPLPSSPPKVDQPPKDATQPTRKERDSLPRVSKACHSHSKKDCEATDKQTESDKHKSNHREHKYHSQRDSESLSRRHKSGSDSSKDSHSHEKIRSHRADKDTEQRYDSRSCKRKSYPYERHHRSDGAKTSSPEILHSASSSVNKKDSKGEPKPDKMVASDPKHGTFLSSKEGHSQEHQKIKNTGGYSRSSDSKDWKKSSVDQHTVHYRDSSKEREGDRRRRREGETCKNHKKSSQSQTSQEREKQRTKESSQSKVDKDRREKTQRAFKTSSDEPNTGEKNSVEENSPNRKLCFMETLNLTLSPIKKPALPIDGIQKDRVPVDEDVENGSNEENPQLNIEDMCVIDEIDNSELEAASGNVAQQSTDDHKDSSSEKILEVSDVEGIQEKDKGQTESPAAHSLIQTTSANSQPLDTTENQITAHLTANSPEKSPVKVVDVSKNHEDNTEPVLDSKTADCVVLEATDGTDPNEKSGSISAQSPTCDLPRAHCGNDAALCAAVTQTVVDSSVEPPETAAQQSTSLDSQAEDVSSHPKKTNVAAAITDEADPESHQSPSATQPQVCQQGSPAASSSVRVKDGHERQDYPKDTVSSAISLESLPQEGLSLTEAIYVLTQTNEDARDASITAEPCSSTSCIRVSKVSSATDKTLPESGLPATPNKGFTPNRQEKHLEPSSSVPLLHDEDSMMRTLSNLKRIPDAISPLRSPARITKRGLLHVHGKPGHVKSLQKDFSSTAVDTSLKKLDVNKENKYPGSPANRDALNFVDKVSDLPSSRSDTDLEEGEILSESDEVAASSPTPATKRAKLAQPVKNKASPESLLKKKSSEKRIAPKQSPGTAGVSTPSPKSRFKTVCPAVSKVSFSTIEEIMETFELIRTELRRKYMKLHKTFPKKSFNGMMDNFQKSFLEFVDGANFGQICNQPEELKSKLKKLIESVFVKVADNGIVTRIFKQQAADLKQKLWDFVTVQVDYLFLDIRKTLKSICKPSRAQPKDKSSSKAEKVSQQSPARTSSCESNRAPSALANPNLAKSCAVVPYKTGLGSRGKDIRITHTEKDGTPPTCPNTQSDTKFLPPKNPPLTPEKNNMSSLVITQNGSVLDKTDFELLTEQQASSLTFNLVRDSQMGEIFKCLLQGSDLLESSGIAGDNTAWSLATPRKDGEGFISITTPSKFDSPSKLLSPTKFDTPSKLIATWSSISPRKMCSPRPKAQTALNPAFLDESCLLEVPSENKVLLHASLAAQKSYAILAEDLAVSLTIPSPLKSDSHLSFLQASSPSMNVMSTPESVISAHISEDALLDGEDATEHDIHLALDTDNSSCGSSSSLASETPSTAFVLKPEMTMQALVLEKSNDHFIVKIRQASLDADSTLIADNSLSETLTEEQHIEEDAAAPDGGAAVVDNTQKAAPSGSGLFDSADTDSSTCLTQVKSLTLLNEPSARKEDISTQQNTSKDTFSTVPLKNASEGSPSGNSSESASTANDGLSQTRVRKEDLSPKSLSEPLRRTPRKKTTPSKSAASRDSRPTESSDTKPSREPLSHALDSESDDLDTSESERRLMIAEDTSSSPEKKQRGCDKGRKRKRHQEKPKAKRVRKDKEENSVEGATPVKKADEDSRSSSTASLSPSSLSAKNVIRRKGEVVIAWTREEDRAILMDMKRKGASRETFSVLSEKLKKPSSQIAHRVHQLMKLFKKMDT